MPTPLGRRTFLALLAAGTVSATVVPGIADAATQPEGGHATGKRGAVGTTDGVVHLGQSYLDAHPAEADAAKLRSLVVGLDPAQPVRPQLPGLVRASSDDFRTDRVVSVDGWYLAVTEARATGAVALGA